MQPTLSRPLQLAAPGQLFAPMQRSATAVAAPAPRATALQHSDAVEIGLVSRLIKPFQNISLAPLAADMLHGLENGIDKGWKALKDTFTFQFEEAGKTGTKREAQANCGPASATMILKQFGVQPPSMQQLRKMVGAPTGTGSRAFGLSTNQVVNAVKKSASQQGLSVKAEQKTLTPNVDAALAEMKKRIAKGEKLILLSSNINSLSRGHYVVVNEVRPDGSIVVDDPARANGENRVHSKAQLAKALQVRQQVYGSASSLISFTA
jgi:hypothetical protein